MDQPAFWIRFNFFSCFFLSSIAAMIDNELDINSSYTNTDVDERFSLSRSLADPRLRLPFASSRHFSGIITPCWYLFSRLLREIDGRNLFPLLWERKGEDSGEFRLMPASEQSDWWCNYAKQNAGALLRGSRTRETARFQRMHLHILARIIVVWLQKHLNKAFHTRRFTVRRKNANDTHRTRRFK